MKQETSTGVSLELHVQAVPAAVPNVVSTLSKPCPKALQKQYSGIGLYTLTLLDRQPVKAGD